MQAIKCELCGSNEFTKVDGLFQCNHCHTKYTLEEAKKLIISGNIEINGEIKVKPTDFIIRTGVLVKYHGISTEVVIPDTVTIIGEEAFKDCFGVKKIKIPNTVIEIKNLAFFNCNALTEIFIPNSVELIGFDIFKGCTSLNQVNLPPSVKSISGYCSVCGMVRSVTNSNNKIQSSKCPCCKKENTLLIDKHLSLTNDVPIAIDNLTKENRYNNLCQHCGGEFKGLFKKVCSKCGKPKDY